MLNTVALVCALSLLAASSESDPRVLLVEEQLAGRAESALARTRELAEADPDLARELWLGYLQGDLLERLGRLEEANAAFGRLLSEDSELAAFGRLRMASLQEDLGHPEVAAGLVATLLGKDATPDLASRATDVLARALKKGADCRLLGRLGAWRVPDAQRRILNLALADCEISRGEPQRAATILIDLLDQETADLVARRAAEHLTALDLPAVELAETQIAIGLAFHHNREFERAAKYLERGLARLDPEHLSISPDALVESRYATARAYFWLRDYGRASGLFEELASSADRDEVAARALYQQARCHELSGDWRKAVATFRRAFLTEPEGVWSAAALFSALRLEFRGGQEQTALKLFEVLDSRPSWGDVARRAALFLVASDVERGRADRAGRWLRRNPGSEAVEEFLYWSGRLAELEASPYLAIRNYVEVIKRGSHHLLATEAAQRLAQGSISTLLEPVGQRLAASTRLGDQHAAWLLLGESTAGGRAARQRLLETVSADRRAQVFLSLELVPPDRWPLWKANLSRPDERLLALGLWAEAEASLARHFPFSEPSLAFSAGALLGGAGLTRRSLRITEVLANGIPSWLPEAILPRPFRRQLYPFPYRSMIERQARRQGIEAYVLAGLIREESRFDPEAVSVASARGLTQFVYPTAIEVAESIDLGLSDPLEIHQPDVAIALGAAYLGRLLRRFDGRLEAAITAYNAGEDQTRLWTSYCYSRNRAEFYSKVGFAQTRSYLRRVWRSRGQYEELYGDEAVKR